MHAKPIILPLDCDGSIYALQDELGRTVGTGTREVCELLLHILNQQSAAGIEKERSTPHPNVRSAIAV